MMEEIQNWHRRTCTKRSILVCLIIPLFAFPSALHWRQSRALEIYDYTNTRSRKIREKVQPSSSSNSNETNASETNQNYLLNATEGSDVTIKNWRQLVESYNMSRFDRFKKMSGKGCGMAVQVHLNDTDDGHDHKHTKAILKAAYSRMWHYDAESHLREVKACFFDKILGTRMVLPCVGHYTAFDDVKNDTLQMKIRNSLKCELAQNSTTKNDTVFFGSMQLWQDGVYTVKRSKIQHAAKDYNNPTELYKNKKHHDSAVRYAVFHYLGACMKSESNHFAHDEYHFLAIDNDRCFTPEAISSGGKKKWRIREWRDLVFGICQFPNDLVQSIIQLARPPRVSERLVKALEEDALSSELLMSQPEAIQEIDERVYKLAIHISQCMQQGRLALLQNETLVQS